MKKRKNSIDALYLRQFGPDAELHAQCKQQTGDHFHFGPIYSVRQTKLFFSLLYLSTLNLDDLRAYFSFSLLTIVFNWIGAICGSMAITLFRIRIELWWWMRFYGLHCEWTEHNIILCNFFPSSSSFYSIFVLCLNITDVFVVTFVFSSLSSVGSH